MKCAKCGNEINPDAPDCPYCTGGGVDGDGTGAAEAAGHPGKTRAGSRKPVFHCPRCGSRRVRMGISGGRAEAVCMDCGSPVQPGGSPGLIRGCGCFLITVVLILLLMFFGGC